MPKVFVSHSTLDRAFVESEIVRFLGGHGVETWYSTNTIGTGESWERSIRAGLEGCDWFLVVLSPRSAQSEWVKDELAWAVEYRQGKIIPVLVETCTPEDFHLRLARIQTIDFRSDAHEARRKLLTVFGKGLPAGPTGFRPGDRPLPGSDWELDEKLGVSAFGESWKATNPHFTGLPPVVLKFCFNPDVQRHLRHEASLLGRLVYELRHPGIVPLRNTYLANSPPCLEYEYLAGTNLDGFVQEQRAEGGPTPALAARIVCAVAETVGFAHRLSPPIVHRDLKPSNILFPRGQTTPVVTGFSGPASLPESPHASPQRMVGESPDPRDDVYSLGVIWFGLVIGDLNATPSAGLIGELRGRGLAEQEASLLASCLAADAGRRPENATILAGRLATFVRA
jgi:hypothetical protein